MSMRKYGYSLCRYSVNCGVSEARKYSVILNNHVVEKTPITAQLWHLRRHGRATNEAAVTAPQMLAKTSLSSKLTLEYQFDSDPALRELYVDHMNNVSIGKLLEDLDAMAGNIAHSHCDDSYPQAPPISLVTASADSIRLMHPISIHERLILTGQVVWVGNSSLDVAVEVHSHSDSPPTLLTNAPSKLLSSLFTYVARDKSSGKPHKVNRLVVAGEEETTFFNSREAIVNERKKAKLGDKSIPSSSEPIFVNGLDIRESHTINELICRGMGLRDMNSLHASKGSVLMSSTGLQSIFICQPQKVNTSGKVFGGFLMHKAYDLAVSTGYVFAGKSPSFREVDKIQFQKPVDIGNLVSMKSRVVFSSGPILPQSLFEKPVIMVEVLCSIINPEKGTTKISNSFHFEFEFEPNLMLMTVLPTNVEESTAMVAAAKAVDYRNGSGGSAAA